MNEEGKNMKLQVLDEAMKAALQPLSHFVLSHQVLTATSGESLIILHPSEMILGNNNMKDEVNRFSTVF